MKAPEGIQTARMYNESENEAISQDYSFTTLSHSHIILVMEKMRLSQGLLKEELSVMAGYGRSRYTNLSTFKSKFSEKSYVSFCNAINGKPVEPRKKSRRGKPFDITLEEAIAICKANGLRVAKSEVTTNWIEL
jgi:hypothetical protein